MMDDGETPSKWRWWVCGWLLLATMILYMDRLVLTQQEAKVRAAFGILDSANSEARYADLDSAFSIAFACGALLFGWLADRWKVWLLYPLVVAMWSLMGCITGMIDDYQSLLVCRFFLGLFEAGHWPCALKTTQRILAPSERTMGNGIMQSGAAIGSVVTPGVLLFFREYVTESWRPPFLVIGGLGLLWAVGWFLIIPRERSAQASPASGTPKSNSHTANENSWFAVYCDRRFWIMVAVVVCINSTWHFFRVWMPVILRRLHDFDASEVQVFSMGYYLSADVGSLATGFGSVWLVSRGFSVHGSRLSVFGFCAALALLSLVAIFVPGDAAFLWALPIVAFASLGMFPPYYSFTQELTVKNQGKVTGSLGFICWMVMAGMRAMEGRVADAVRAQGGDVAQEYTFGITLAGVMPLAALFTLIFFWPRESASKSGSKLQETAGAAGIGLAGTAPDPETTMLDEDKAQ